MKLFVHTISDIFIIYRINAIALGHFFGQYVYVGEYTNLAVLIWKSDDFGENWRGRLVSVSALTG